MAYRVGRRLVMSACAAEQAPGGSGEVIKQLELAA